MNNIRQFIGRAKIQLRGKNHIVGWNMMLDEAIAFFKRQGKIVLTFFGYAVSYEDEENLRKIIRHVLSKHSPARTLINYGATIAGLGVVYPIAKSMGFTTRGIVSTVALEYPEEISPDADHICFIADTRWGGKLPDSNELSPTSKAMVECSDILVAIGGGEISRDELLAGKEQGKPIQYYPAEVSHAWAIERAKRRGLPPPKSFLGAVHEVFGK
jgi:hypothetical protein